MRSVLLLLGLASVARADVVARWTLPEGRTLSLEGGQVVVRRGGLAAKLGPARSIDDVEFRAGAKPGPSGMVSPFDGPRAVVKLTRDGCHMDALWTLDRLDTRLACATGDELLARRDWTGAEAAFRSALAITRYDTDATYGLATALVGRGDVEHAAGVLHPSVDTYAYLLAAPELAPLLAHPSFRAFTATAPTKVALVWDQPEDLLVAHSRGLVAVHHRDAVRGGCGYRDRYSVGGLRGSMFGGTQLEIVDERDWTCTGGPAELTLAGRAHVAARLQVASKLLSDLGFWRAPAEWAAAQGGRIELPRARLELAIANSKAELTRDGHALGHDHVMGALFEAFYLPDAGSVLVVTTVPSMCGGDFHADAVIALPKEELE